MEPREAKLRLALTALFVLFGSACCVAEMLTESPNADWASRAAIMFLGAWCAMQPGWSEEGDPDA